MMIISPSALSIDQLPPLNLTVKHREQMCVCVCVCVWGGGYGLCVFHINLVRGVERVNRVVLVLVAACIYCFIFTILIWVTPKASWSMSSLVGEDKSLWML